VLGAAALPLVAAGCDAQTSGDPAASPTGSVTPSGSTESESPTPAADPDADLLLDVRIALAGAEVLTRETARRHPALAAPARRLRRVHRAHLAVFADLDPAPAPAFPQVPASTPRARARLVRAEDELATLLADSSLAADSGPLARVLASMAAGVDQARRGLAGPGAA